MDVELMGDSRLVNGECIVHPLKSPGLVWYDCVGEGKHLGTLKLHGPMVARNVTLNLF